MNRRTTANFQQIICCTDLIQTWMAIYLVRIILHFQYEAPGRSQRYEGHLESKERFAIQRYLLIIGKKQNMRVLSHTFTYFST